MISPLYLSYAILGGIIQLSVIWAMRSMGWPFIWAIPAILAHQYLFITAYSKAPNFVIQWFLTAAITGFASFILGWIVFGDKLSWINAVGMLLIFVGLGMLRFK